MTTPTVSPVTYRNIAAQSGFLLIKAQTKGTTVNVYNGDITNVLLVSPSPSPADSNSIPIQPLTNATIDASRAQYATAEPGQVVAQVVLSPSSQLSASPAQIAAQISALGLATAVNQTTQIAGADDTNAYLAGTQAGALISDFGISVAQDMLSANAAVTEEIAALLATGVPGGPIGGIPLLRYTNSLGFNTAGLAIAHSATTIIVNDALINQPGYEGLINVNFPAGAGTLPFVTLLMQWLDTASGLSVDTEQFILTGGNGPTNSLPFYISGPCRGDHVTISVMNNDPAQTATITYAFNQNSHIYTHDRILQSKYATTAPITFTNPNGVPTPGVLFQAAPSTGPSATSSRLVCVWNGSLWLTMDNSGQANALALSLTDASGLLSGSTTSEVFSQTVAAGVRLMQECALPNGPMLLNIRNTGTTGNIAPIITGVKKEY